MSSQSNNSVALSLGTAVNLIGKKVTVELHNGTKRTGYLKDVYNEKNPFIVLEVAENRYEDRKLSKIKGYKVIA